MIFQLGIVQMIVRMEEFHLSTPWLHAVREYGECIFVHLPNHQEAWLPLTRGVRSGQQALSPSIILAPRTLDSRKTAGRDHWETFNAPNGDTRQIA